VIFLIVVTILMQDTMHLYHHMYTLYPGRFNAERVNVGEMKLYFVVDSAENGGSSKLRAYQVSKELNSEHGVDAVVLSQIQVHEYMRKGGVTCDEQYKAHVFIWIKSVNKELFGSLRRCGSITCSIIHVFDVVDSYALHKKEVRRLCENIQFDVVITNSKLMSEDMYNSIRNPYPTRYVVVHHHWDPDFNVIADNEKEDKAGNSSLVFGFLGSTNSFVHSDNFLHLRKLLASDFQVAIVDTESGLDVTSELKFIAASNKPYSGNVSRHRTKIPFNNIEIPFNVHLSIREEGTDLFKFKTTAKITTAAALNHVIVSTKEAAASELLPEDYPFWLESSRENCFFGKLHEIEVDYNTNKTLWNRARAILKSVRRETTLKQICSKQYMPLLSSLAVPGRINDGFYLV
jgi:hypothetical protein